MLTLNSLPSILNKTLFGSTSNVCNRQVFRLHRWNSQRVHKLGLHLFWVPFYVSMLNFNRSKPVFNWTLFGATSMFAIERCLDNTGKKSQRVHKLGLHLFWVPFNVSMLNSNRLKPFFKPNTLWSNRREFTKISWIGTRFIQGSVYTGFRFIYPGFHLNNFHFMQY
jgi:hypothetical protein